MDRSTIVSCDCHAAATPAEYRKYRELAYREGYDAWVANPEAVRRLTCRTCGPAFRSKGRRPG